MALVSMLQAVFNRGAFSGLRSAASSSKKARIIAFSIPVAQREFRGQNRQPPTQTSYAEDPAPRPLSFSEAARRRTAIWSKARETCPAMLNDNLGAGAR